MLLTEHIASQVVHRAVLAKSSRAESRSQTAATYEIELFFAGQGSRDLELHPSRTEPWRNTGHVLSSRASLWRVRFRYQLPPALDAALVPRALFPGP